MIISHTEYPFEFDSRKALEAVLYICKRAPIADRIHICKIMYFADKYHMEKFARFICGDLYKAMEYGPVPNGTYNLIIAGEREEIPELAVNDVNVAALREPNMDVFSKSDIEALNWSIRRYGNFSFDELKAASHDESWKRTTNDGEKIYPKGMMKSIPMPLEDIVLTLQDGEDLLEYIYQYN
jgi:uncharacterized phage-associated protein